MQTISRRSEIKIDQLLTDIADYVHDYSVDSDEAFDTARACLADSLGCGLLALNYPECTKLMGPLMAGTVIPKGCLVPGTQYVLDPIRAAFNIGMMIRWLDYNDTWLAAEWGHPSDNLGALLAASDYLCQQQPESYITVRQLLSAMVKAHEIQGVLALQNSFNRLGFDHVILVKIASTAVSAGLLGGNKEQIADAVSQAFVDAGPLRTYRHAPNTGSRKSWAAGDATSRGLMFAWMTLEGEMGYSQALTAPKWGFNDVMLKGKEIVMERPLGSYVMENVLFKISFPAEFHSQTALEAAIQLHPEVAGRLDEIDRVAVDTHESAIRIIDKKGPLHNPADRDHCLQYIIAIGLIHGGLNADHYEDSAAADPRIDALREKMVITENMDYSRDYLDPDKRSIASGVQVFFKDGTSTDRIAVDYPIGHRRRREEGIPLLYEKFRNNVATRYDEAKAKELIGLWNDPKALDQMSVHELLRAFHVKA